MRSVRFVGSFKLEVSFAKEPYKRDDISRSSCIIPYDISMIWGLHIGGMKHPYERCFISELHMGASYGCFISGASYRRFIWVLHIIWLHHMGASIGGSKGNRAVHHTIRAVHDMGASYRSFKRN